MRRSNRRSTGTSVPSSSNANPISLFSSTGFSQHQHSSSFSRWRAFLSLPSPPEYIISVDHHQIWRRHLAWSHREGDTLKNAVTSRFASNMVFMSLLLGAEIAVLFSPSKPAQLFREAMAESRYRTVYFWGGIFLCISIGMTLSTLLANFTAWAIIGAVSSQNSHAVLRSSIGLYAAQLPARMAVLSIYCFVIWVVLFLFELLPSPWSFIVAIFIFVMFVHIVVVYSAFGRLVMYTKAMRKEEIFKEEEEDSMTANRLSEELLKIAVEEKKRMTPLPLYYRKKIEIQKQVSKLMISCDGVEEGYCQNQNVTTYLSNILESPEMVSDTAGGRSEPLELPDFGSKANEGLANVANTAIASLEDTDWEHPLKRNGHRRGLSGGGKAHRRESSGIVLQKTMVPQSPGV
ncbi:hypothetical protein HJC23_007878 [Cyclotella cryptica]|uniref:Uncharacterized protein n=1 Tax=Cyclotella cryptica TaxID=29204 RepID=A0ABD3R059_9STRA|eukprot:CCRYP_000218-RA/>CCRYP_000218-RA protein AED:0.00 eAED:0.00 QI:154/-1/1/1/-1/1/1/239/403